MNYIINRNKDEYGRNEVHREGCGHMPLPMNRVPLGNHANGISAVSYAKRIGWSAADGCFHCAREAHRK